MSYRIRLCAYRTHLDISFLPWSPYSSYALTTAWGYKYSDGPESLGVNVHGDAAAVNVNCWITDEDDIEGDGGGDGRNNTDASGGQGIGGGMTIWVRTCCLPTLAVLECRVCQ